MTLYMILYLENYDYRDASEKENREDKVGAGEDGQGELVTAVAHSTHDSYVSARGLASDDVRLCH